MDLPILTLLDTQASVAWIEQHFHPDGGGCLHCQAQPDRRAPLSYQPRQWLAGLSLPDLSGGSTPSTPATFGNVCVGSFADEPLTLSNSGHCPLTVTGITSSSPEFIPPGVDAYPLVAAAGGTVEVQIRFQPTSFGPKSATLTVTSDDPSGPRSISVSGNVPSGKLAVSGTTQFGGIEFGRRAQQRIAVCNVGMCDLHVTKVAFKPLCGCDGEYDETGCGHDRDCGCGHQHEHKQERECDQRCSQFKLLNNPFPVTLRPGSCLPLMIQFTPRCDTARCCELVIESDDPSMPETTLYITGHLRRTLSSALKCWAAEELRELLDAGRH